MLKESIDREKMLRKRRGTHTRWATGQETGLGNKRNTAKTTQRTNKQNKTRGGQPGRKQRVGDKGNRTKNNATNKQTEQKRFVGLAVPLFSVAN